MDVFSIKPPRLEDAGLEDTALLPDAIQEAFRLASEKVRSAAAEVLDRMDINHSSGGFSEEGNSIDKQWGDALVDSVENGQQGSCIDICTGGLLEEDHDSVIDYGDHMEDKLIELRESGPEVKEGSCIADGFEPEGSSDKCDGHTDPDAPGLTVAYVQIA